MPRKDGWVRWVDLLRRVFEIDVLHCARCGGRLRFVAAIDDPEVVRFALMGFSLLRIRMHENDRGDFRVSTQAGAPAALAWALR